jgi:soluble lytic murein transglycosylase-like protein
MQSLSGSIFSGDSITLRSAIASDPVHSSADIPFQIDLNRLCLAGTAAHPIYNFNRRNQLTSPPRRVVGFLPFSAAVKNASRHRDKSLPTWTPPRDYRIICNCQTHRARRLIQALRVDDPLAFAAAQVKKRAAALLIAVPLAFGALYPIDAMNLADQLISGPPEVAAAARLGLITPRIQETFLGGDNKHSAPALNLEVAKEQFFRSEIPWGSVIYREAKNNGLQPELVAAVIEAESDFRPALISQKDAKGLMQIVPETGRLMGVDDLLNPRENIRAGSRYLRYLVDRYKGNQRMALAAYNAGEGNVARFGGVPPFRETMDYIQRVATRRMLYQRRVDRHFVASLRMRVDGGAER